MAQVVFPLYRRSAFGTNLYRIEAPDRFTEVQLIGTRATVHQVVVTAYPEMVRIREMIDAGIGGGYVILSQKEFDAALSQALGQGGSAP